MRIDNQSELAKSGADVAQLNSTVSQVFIGMTLT